MLRRDETLTRCLSARLPGTCNLEFLRIAWPIDKFLSIFRLRKDPLHSTANRKSGELEVRVSRDSLTVESTIFGLQFSSMAIISCSIVSCMCRFILSFFIFVFTAVSEKQIIEVSHEWTFRNTYYKCIFLFS